MSWLRIWVWQAELKGVSIWLPWFPWQVFNTFSVLHRISMSQLSWPPFVGGLVPLIELYSWDCPKTQLLFWIKTLSCHRSHPPKNTCTSHKGKRKRWSCWVCVPEWLVDGIENTSRGRCKKNRAAFIDWLIECQGAFNSEKGEKLQRETKQHPPK